MSAEAVYSVFRDGVPAAEDEHPKMVWVEEWPKTLNGVVTATTRAAFLSLRAGPHEVRRPDGERIARYVDGRRAELDPGGIIAMAEQRRAEAEAPERPRAQYADRKGYEAHFNGKRR